MWRLRSFSFCFLKLPSHCPNTPHSTVQLAPALQDFPLSPVFGGQDGNTNLFTKKAPATRVECCLLIFPLEPTILFSLSMLMCHGIPLWSSETGTVIFQKKLGSRIKTWHSNLTLFTWSNIQKLYHICRLETITSEKNNPKKPKFDI